jgi:hypothetical protein
MGGPARPARERARALPLSAAKGRSRRWAGAPLPYGLPSGGTQVETLENELDRLYGFDPGDFVGERDRLARELREAGRRDEAEQVKALRKPTVSAWTINQLARQERREVDLLLDAGHRLREAQQGVLAGSDRATLDDARRTEREALANLRKAASSILAESGRGGETALNRTMQTLQAAAVSAEGRELLARGRFSGDLEATGFELLAPLAEKPRKRPARPKKGAAPRRQQREHADAARAELREARSSARAAQKDLREAEREADKVRRELARAEEGVEKRRAAAVDAEAAVERAEQQLHEAEGKA